MMRTFKYRLRPTPRQAAVLLAWLEACRVLYNAALQQRREAWARRQVSLSLFDQHEDLTALRADDPAWASLPLSVERSALRRLQRAFEAFFRRVKTHQTPGYPRFRGRGWFDSFGIGRATVRGKRVLVPRLGAVRVSFHRPLEGAIRDVHLGRSCGHWWVAFACDLGPAPEKRPVASAVGIDLGLTTFATLSDGGTVENPRFFREGEALLARRQRVLSRRQRRSRSRARARLLVARAHAHIRHQRLDFARKVAADLYRRYDLIAYEDLNLKGLASSRLAKSVQDAAWGTFVRCLALKAESAGPWAVPVDPRRTSQRCSACGALVPKPLAERVHRCPCGFTLDRDENAARNVLALGRSAVPTAEVL